LRFRLIDLVDRDDHWHFGGSRVIDSFESLWHHAVIGRNNQHYNIGDPRSSCSHHRERFVTWSVEEDNSTLALGIVRVGHIHRVGAYVLGDAARLAFRHSRLTNGVEQRSLSVIDVAHHGNDRRPRQRAFFAGFDDLLFLGVADHLLKRDEVDVVAELLAYLLCDVLIQRLIDSCHYAALEQHLHNVFSFDFELLGKVL
jgi:hypothetical protein